MKSHKSYDDICILQLTAKIQDEDGYLQDYPEGNIEREVFVNKKSVKRGDFYASQQTGKEVTLVLEMNADEYDGEKIVIYNQKKYEVVRDYVSDADPHNIELMCSDIGV